MGVRRIREDSIAAGTRQKTAAELAEENEQLQRRMDELTMKLTDTQLALCDVYEQLVGGEA